MVQYDVMLSCILHMRASVIQYDVMLSCILHMGASVVQYDVMLSCILHMGASVVQYDVMLSCILHMGASVVQYDHSCPQDVLQTPHGIWAQYLRIASGCYKTHHCMQHLERKTLYSHIFFNRRSTLYL